VKAWLAIGSLVVAVVLSAVPSVGATGAATLEHYCPGTVYVHGYPYGYEGTGVRCNFMRFWTKRSVDHGGEPRHWTCLDLGETGYCHRRDHQAKFDYYLQD
jgi:hypothetical protein